MKHIYNYTDFKTNEEFLGGVLNFFKGLWKKVAAELQKLEDDPNKIKDYIVNNTLNPKSPNNIFQKEIDIFNKTNGGNKEAFALVNSILNKDSGILGKQGIGLLFNDKSLQGDKMKTKRITFEYIINSVRDQISNNVKYTKPNEDINDTTYLPSLKVILKKNAPIAAQTISGTQSAQAQNTPPNPNAKPPEKVEAKVERFIFRINEAENQAEASKNKENVITWLNTNIITPMITAVKAVKEDDIKEAISKGGGSLAGEYKVGDTVRYKMKSFIEGTPPDDQKENVGNKQIIKIEGDNYIFKDNKGLEFTKTKDQILSKAEGDDAAGAEVVDKLKDKLAAIKGDKDKMDMVDKVVDIINTEPEKVKAIITPTATT
jgi:hypothetical protein